jgi:hypothetical protein
MDDQIKEGNMGGHGARMGQVKNAYRIFVEKTLKGQLGRPRHRWDSSTGMNSREVGWDG